MLKKPTFSLVVIGALLLLVLAAGACAPAATPEPPPPPTDVPPPPPPTATPAPDHSAYEVAVAGNAHNTYDVGHGPNTWCTRCHSPQNWDPESFQGPPPACFTCKFGHEEEMRVAEGNPFVPEEEWVGMPCETCHVVDGNGYVTPGIAWLNPVSMDYVAVSNSTELCEKCHVTMVGTNNPPGSFVDHKVTLGGSAHLNYGGFIGEVPPPSFCADCHDPHTLEPKQCVDCHEGVTTSATHMKGYNAVMLDKLTCMACHDSSCLADPTSDLCLDVGPPPDDEGGKWVTQKTTVVRGSPSTDVVLSHSIVYEVACDRCHFEGNTFELTVLTADGEVPEPPADE